MKSKPLEKLYAVLLLVVFGGVIVHAPLSVGLGTLFPAYELPIKAWKEMVMLAAVIVAAVIVTRRGMWRELLHDGAVRLVAVFGALHIALAVVFYKGFAATVAGLMIDLRFVLFFGLVFVLMRLEPRWRRPMVYVGIGGAFVVVGFAVLQLFLPPDILSHIGYSRDTISPYLTVDKNPAYIRINSTLRGPNPLGAYAGMVLGFIAAALARGRLQPRGRKALAATAMLASCSLIALWVSYSRSALAAAAITVLTVGAISIVHTISRRAWIIIAVIVVALSGGLVASLKTPFVSNVLLHESQGDNNSSLSSNEGHVQSLEAGMQALVRQPWGSGIGSTGSASLFGPSPIVVENQYLFVAHEAGWLGLLLFLALYGLVMKRLWHRKNDWLALGAFASGVGMGLIGLLLPVWADDTISIVWWGLAAVAIGGNYDRKQAK